MARHMLVEAEIRLRGLIRQEGSMRPENENILRALQCARQLLFLADKGDMQRTDGGCGVLYGIIRDSGYKIREQAELERSQHFRNGTWDADEMHTGEKKSVAKAKTVKQRGKSP